MFFYQLNLSTDPILHSISYKNLNVFVKHNVFFLTFEVSIDC